MAIRIVGIDPGLAACGVAYFDGVQWFTATIRTEGKDWGRDLSGRLTHIKGKLKTFLSLHRCPSPVDVLVVEMMNTHDGRRTDKQDLIPLAMIGGMSMVVVPARHVWLPLPSTWKGSVPKPVHHRRLKAQVPELAGKRVSTDAWDAVGLALYGKRIYNALPDS